MSPDLVWARRLTWLAVFGAALGAVGDVLLLYYPEGGYEDPDMAFMATISNQRLLAGHLLGIFAIPLEAGGLWLVWKALLPAGRTTANLSAVLGAYVVSIGTATHALFYPVAEAARTGPEQVAEVKSFLDPVAGMFVLGFFILFIAVIVLVLKGKTLLPKWVVWATPISVYLISILFYIAFPLIGNFMIPAAFNLGMMVFYLILLRAMKNDSNPGIS